MYEIGYQFIKKCFFKEKTSYQYEKERELHSVSPGNSFQPERTLILNKIHQEPQYEGNCRKKSQAAAYAVFQAKLLMRVPGFPTRKDRDHMYEEACNTET